MSKVTKKQLQHSIDLLNKENSSQHEYLMRIKRALKSIDIDILSDEFDEPKPQLKQLDQSVFNGLDEKWRFAMVSSVGIPFVYDYKPTGKRHFLSDSSAQLMVNLGKVMRIDEYDYDASNWQNSLIERDIAKELLEVDLSELTGSELCRAMINKNDWVLAYVSDENDATAEFHQRPAIVTGATIDGRFKCGEITWRFAVPINNQGEPLTQSDVGL